MVGVAEVPGGQGWVCMESRVWWVRLGEEAGRRKRTEDDARERVGGGHERGLGSDQSSDKNRVLAREGATGRG